MQIRPMLILSLACCAGCYSGDESTHDSSAVSSPITESADAGIDFNSALANIRVGTMEAELLATMKPIALDCGTVYWGGNWFAENVFSNYSRQTNLV